MTRIVIDCEFVDLPWNGAKMPLWVGLAREDGASWSAVNADVDAALVNDWTSKHVVPLVPPDEPLLTIGELAEAVREFCAGVSEWWAWCPAVDELMRGFELARDTAMRYHREFWDWDLQLIRNVVVPWPNVWPDALRDLHRLAIDRAVPLPSTERPHHPRYDAEWGLNILRAAGSTRQPAEAVRSSHSIIKRSQHARHRPRSARLRSTMCAVLRGQAVGVDTARRQRIGPAGYGRG